MYTLVHIINNAHKLQYLLKKYFLFFHGGYFIKKACCRERGREEGYGGQGGEMSQTMYARMNK
jgi:hypothetical protein